MYTCIIVEDEWPVLRHLEQIIKQADCKLRLLAGAQNINEAIKAVEKHKPQLVFLDVQLGNETGFALLEHFREPLFETIVVTGFDQYAIEALRWCAADYLLKPVTCSQLNEAVGRVIKRLENGSSQRKTIADNLLAFWQWQMLNDYRQIVLPVTGEQIVVTLSEILWLESKGSYTQFYFTSGTSLLIGKGLFQYSLELEAFGFIRCHQSYLVNRRYIRKLVNTLSAREIVLTTGLSIPVSRQYYKLAKKSLLENGSFWPAIDNVEGK